MIRVLIADDHAVVREGIKRIIADAGDMIVAGEVGSGAELLQRVMRENWDVVVMDLAMPQGGGLEVLQDLRRLRPELPVLVFSMYPEDQYAVRTLTAGAAGYVHKGSAPDELVAAIRTVHGKRRYVSSGVAESLAAHSEGAPDRPQHEALSNREYQVLCLIASGKSVSDIAEELTLSVKTISTFRSRVLHKLGLRHNAELTRYALKHGLVD